MAKVRNNSVTNILIGLVIILSISTGYFVFDKYKQSSISKLNREYRCINPQKLCSLIEYKYTDQLEVRLYLIPGQYYFEDEKLELFEEYLSNWKKNINRKDDGFDTGQLFLEDFTKSLKVSNGKLYIVFEDSDEFEIEQLILDLSDKTKDAENGIKTRSITINKNGNRIMRYYAYKKKIELEKYKRISTIDILWQNIAEDLPEK